MKVIRISDTIHEHLKQVAKREGRTLQWVVEQRLTELPQQRLTEDRGTSAGPINIGAPDFGMNAATAIEKARTPSQVAKEAYALKDQLEAEKKDNETNQDPDYWADFNARYKQIDELWTEFRQLKGNSD